MANQEEIAFKVSVDNSDGAKSLKDLKKEFSELNTQLSNTKEGTEEYYATLKKLGKTKDDIGDLRSQINALNPEGKVQAFANLGSKLTAGFGAATGAAALFGKQSEEVSQALLKVQASLALSQGIKEVVGLGDAFKEVGVILKTNPILLIASIVTAIGVALYALKDKIKPIGDAFDYVGGIIDEYIIQPVTKFLDLIGLTNSELDAMGDALKTATDKGKVALDAQTDAFDRQIKVAQAAGKSTVELEQAKQQAIIDTNKRLVEQTIEYVRQGGILDDERKKALTEQLKAIANARTDQQVIEAKSNKESLDNYKKLNEEKLKDDKDTWDKTVEIRRSNLDAQAEDDKRLKQEAKDQAALDQQEQLDYINETTSQEQKIEGANFDYKKEKRAAELADFKTNREQQTTAVKASLQAAQALTDLFFSRQLNNAKGNLKAENEIRKKQFNVNKAFGIVNAVIDGVGSVQKALNNPYPLNLILAAASGILAAVNVAKIASSKFEPTAAASGGGGGADAIPIPAPPSINNPNNTVTKINEDGTVNRDSQKNLNPTINVKASIGVDEVTEKQQRVEVLEKRSTF